MSKLSTLRIIPGMTVLYHGRRYHVADLASSTHALIKDQQGRPKTVPAAQLIPDMSSSSEPLPDIETIPGSDWDDAVKIYDSIEPLIRMGKGARTRAEVRAVAITVGKDISTVYRWLEDYEATGLLSSLMRKPRSDKGKRRLDERVEAIIAETIDSFYLNKQKRTPAKTVFEVRKKCTEAGLPLPAPETVRNRIFEVSEETRLRRRKGAKAANERFQPLRGSFPGADFPLAVVQIDHTPVDVIIVDDVHRKPIKRPYLTIATDVYSKMCVGFYLSLDPPGALATGLCISRAILSKETYLAKMGIDDLVWPCFGVMHKIHTDNAKEFRGTMLGNAATQYGIITERRPRGRPQYGGDVERAFRTFMHEMHNEIPGTTFSNVQEKQEYDSEGSAVMTLDALEKWFTMFLLGVYHQRPHAGNDGLPPIVQWERGVFGTETERGTGIPMRVPDEDRLKLDFMPFNMRTVQEYGILNLGVYYWADALRGFIHALDPLDLSKKQEFICRYDPRDLSKIWMYEPKSGKYIEVPYRDLSRPPVSMWELKEAKRKLREESKAVTNEELIFRTIDKMRALVDSEAEKSKSARIKQQRQKQHKSAPKVTLDKPVEIPRKAPTLSEPESDEEEFIPIAGIRES